MNRFFKIGWIFVLTVVVIMIVMGPGCMPMTHFIVERVADSYPEALFYVPTEQPLVALTIDDAPDARTTPQILDVLKQYHAHATFFIITEYLKGNEAIVRRMLQEGHEIGNHMTRDEPTRDLPFEEFVRKFNRADSILRQFAPVHWLRPGSAFYTREMVNYLKEDPRGYRLVLGSVYPVDAQIPFTSWATHYIDWSTRAGDIIVLHDHGKRGERTIKTLGEILPHLEKKGLTVVTLSTLYQARSDKNLEEPK